MRNQVTRSFFHVCAFGSGRHLKQKEQGAKGTGRGGLSSSMQAHQLRVERAEAGESGGKLLQEPGTDREKGLNKTITLGFENNSQELVTTWKTRIEEKEDGSQIFGSANQIN